MALKEVYKYVVVGGGVAAGYAAREFVARGVAAGSVLIVSRESVAPYERPALSKGFLSADPPARLPGFHTCVGGGGERQTPAWYAEHGIELALGETVTSLDASARRIALASGASVTASDALIVATGAGPVRLDKLPGAQLAGVHYLREHDEGLDLHNELKAIANAGDRTVVCLGGGYIGMEVAAAAAAVGCTHVTMVFPEDHVMPRLFTPELAARYEERYAEKGVQMLKGGRIAKAFHAAQGNSGSVGKVELGRLGEGDAPAESEQVPADLVVVGVGARPEVALLRGQVEMDDATGGVRVDAAMQTSAAGVYAVGDIASFELSLYGDGRRVRMEHVAHARASAAAAVRAAMGDAPSSYDYVPYFYSRVFDLSWQFFGDAPTDADTVLLGDMKPKLFAAWLHDGRVTGVFMESPSADDSASLRAVAIARPHATAAELNAAASPDAALALLAARCSSA